MTADSERSALADAFAMLGRRDFTVARLSERLGSRGHDEVEVRAAIERCAELGYLDDHAYGTTRAETVLRRRPCGYAVLLDDLRRQGLARTMTEQVAEEAYDAAGGQRAVLQDALRRWIERNGEPADWPAIRRCSSHLNRRGFTGHDVQAALSSWLDNISS